MIIDILDRFVAEIPCESVGNTGRNAGYWGAGDAIVKLIPEPHAFPRSSLYSIAIKLPYDALANVRIWRDSP